MSFTIAGLPKADRIKNTKPGDVFSCEIGGAHYICLAVKIASSNQRMVAFLNADYGSGELQTPIIYEEAFPDVNIAVYPDVRVEIDNGEPGYAALFHNAYSDRCIADAKGVPYLVFAAGRAQFINLQNFDLSPGLPGGPLYYRTWRLLTVLDGADRILHERR